MKPQEEPNMDFLSKALAGIPLTGEHYTITIDQTPGYSVDASGKEEAFAPIAILNHDSGLFAELSEDYGWGIMDLGDEFVIGGERYFYDDEMAERFSRRLWRNRKIKFDDEDNEEILHLTFVEALGIFDELAAFHKTWKGWQKHMEYCREERLPINILKKKLAAQNQRQEQIRIDIQRFIKGMLDIPKRQREIKERMDFARDVAKQEKLAASSKQ